MEGLRVVALLLLLTGGTARADVKVTVGDVADRRMRGQVTGGLDVELRLSAPELADCRGYRVTVKTARDDMGSTVPEKSAAPQRNFLILRKAMNPLGMPLAGNEHSIRILFKNPARAAATLKELSGEVVLFNPVKDPECVVTKQLSEAVGRPLEDESLKRSEIEITFLQPKEREVEYVLSDPKAKIGVIDFHEKSGKRREPLRMITTKEGDRMRVKSAFTEPLEDPVAKIYLATEAAQQRVPFHLQDVPLP